MTFKNYTVTLEPRNGFQLPEGIPPIFGCSVSEPSAFGATPRGLTFTNENFQVIDGHPLFTHLHTFRKDLNLGNAPEAVEVDAIIWERLIGNGITPSNVNVRVQYKETVTV